MKPFSIWVGFDPREAEAFAVARSSAKRHAGHTIPVRGLVLQYLRNMGLYTRPTERRDGNLYDVISEHPMATEFACSRFLIPKLTTGWALFMDCDMLIRKPLENLFYRVEKEFRSKAIVCVKHDFAPKEKEKMDGQVQSRYARKNWSSFMIINCDHPANEPLTTGNIANELPGRDLHRFCWIDDDGLIGGLGVEWNWLEGHSDPSIDPANVHWTDGVPSMAGYEDAAYADEYWAAMHDWAAGKQMAQARKFQGW